ncbi:hypothetical protein B0T14DRAFT_604538 [Immersiella caudata]|uniref:Uncharacterized protein n=1 Tax=Immersiella caudata TaxID=314043 RepID=A0AA40BWD0_9PEZI|nr:hypothetical protein B0T14DRAFT_604538 [Immersiella caudata]
MSTNRNSESEPIFTWETPIRLTIAEQWYLFTRPESETIRDYLVYAIDDVIAGRRDSLKSSDVLRWYDNQRKRKIEYLITRLPALYAEAEQFTLFFGVKVKIILGLTTTTTATTTTTTAMNPHADIPPHPIDQERELYERLLDANLHVDDLINDFSHRHGYDAGQLRAWERSLSQDELSAVKENLRKLKFDISQLGDNVHAFQRSMARLRDGTAGLERDLSSIRTNLSNAEWERQDRALSKATRAVEGFKAP